MSTLPSSPHSSIAPTEDILWPLPHLRLSLLHSISVTCMSLSILDTVKILLFHLRYSEI